MDKLDLQDLVSIRAYLIERYQSLEGGNSSSNSVMRQAETAEILEKAVRSLDTVLSRHVSIE